MSQTTRGLVLFTLLIGAWISFQAGQYLAQQTESRQSSGPPAFENSPVSSILSTLQDTSSNRAEENQASHPGHLNDRSYELDQKLTRQLLALKKLEHLSMNAQQKLELKKESLKYLTETQLPWILQRQLLRNLLQQKIHLSEPELFSIMSRIETRIIASIGDDDTTFLQNLLTESNSGDR